METPRFDHHIEWPPVPMIAGFPFTASASAWFPPVPDTRRYFDPSGQEETKEEFDAAMAQWRAAMDDAMRAKVAEDERLKQESSWKARLDRMIKSVTEF